MLDNVVTQQKKGFTERNDFNSKYNQINLDFNTNIRKSTSNNLSLLSRTLNNEANQETLEKYKRNILKREIISNDFKSKNGNINKFKEDIDTLFQKKKHCHIFTNFNSHTRHTNNSTTNKSITLNAEKIPVDMFCKIKKTLPEYLNIKDHYLHDRTENKIKIERMKEKVDKFFQ